ncbi:MAG TPA: amino acid ABC transporter permease [Actinomycetota bacterium]|nr:amino acid ABC transporter permease [Actinomycetota bacterium]
MTETVLYDSAGPRGRRRILIGSVAGGLLVALLVGLAVARLAANGVFEAERWRVLTQGDLQRLLGRGLAATLRAALVAMVLAMAVGGLLAVARLSRRRWLAMPAGAWVELFRGLPLLLLILFLFLGLPAVGLTVSTFWALVAGLTLYNSAVIGEIFRAGILSLPKGQTEAAYSIGLRRGQSLRLILIPQAVRRMLPALISQAVTLLKDTSLGFVIAYAELLRTGRNAVEFLGGPYSIPVYVAIAVLYIAVNASLSFLARWLDRRTRRRLGRTVQPSVADEAA